MTARFRAMACDVVVEGAGDGSLARIVRLFRSRERALSRFSTTSDLSRLNEAPGHEVLVSDVLAGAIGDALAAARATGGLVDPTIAASLITAGYDRDFRQILSSDGHVAPRPAGPAGRVAEVELRGRLVRRPPGLLLDLNGVVKGRAVDDALALLSGPGFVSAGGDVAVASPTTVGLPAGDAATVRRGGIATSGTLTRSWRRGNRVVHHLIDPRTGSPSTSGWAAVTVAAGSCLGADVAAKAAFLLDADGPSWLDERALPGRFLRSDGGVVVNDSWRSSMGAPARRTA